MNTGDNKAVTAVVTRIVKPGCEEAFEVAIQAFVQRTLDIPGQLGVHVLRPTPGGREREYGILRRYANRQAMDAFYSSDTFVNWNQSVNHMVEGPGTREVVSGLEAWFTAPGRPIIPPARWRMATITLIGVFPLSYFLPILLQPVTRDLPRWASVLVIAIGVVSCLTWLVMPNLSRIFQAWLRPANTEK